MSASILTIENRLPVDSNVNYEEIERYGKIVEGKVIKIEPNHQFRYNKVNPCKVTYSFDIDEHQLVDSMVILDREVKDKYPVGQNVKIKEHNRLSMLSGEKPFIYKSFSRSFLNLTMLIPMLLIAGVLVSWLLKKFRVVLSMYKHALSIKGKVVKVTDKPLFPLSSGFPSLFLITYEYVFSDGETYIGQVQIRTNTKAKIPNIGETIDLFVQDNTSPVSCLYPHKVALRNNWEPTN